MRYDSDWQPYVSVAERRRRANKEIAKLKKSGRVIRPVKIEGIKIAKTFWGGSWCKNLEAYSDYANRLPRGRTYARNGSVIDLQLEAGRVQALVSGSNFYTVDIKIIPLAKKHWSTIKIQCAGKIDSMVELLQGSISKGVMELVTQHDNGLFPSPKEIALSCSCPDGASMCKHVAAALYGVGARLDHEPEMLFTLRGVDPAEMIASAVTDAPTKRRNGRGRLLKTDDVSSVFGIDLDMGDSTDSLEEPQPRLRKRKKATAKTLTKKRSRVQSTPVSKNKSVAKKKTTTKPATKKATARRSATTKGTTTLTKKVTKKTAKKATTSKASTRTARKKTVAAPARVTR